MQFRTWKYFFQQPLLWLLLQQLQLRIFQSFFSLKMQVNQEQTPYPLTQQYDEDAIIQQVLRMSLQIENSRTYSQANGLPHRYRKMVKNMKMGRSSQKCSVCIEAFKVDEIIKKFPCGHIFHHNCAKAWLRVNKRCPLCRLDLEQHFELTEISMSQKEQISS